MKTIKNIDDKPPHFDVDIEPETLLRLPTYRKMFRSAIGNGLAKDGEAAMDLIQLGLKFTQVESDISLEDAEFKILKDRCASNTPQWAAHFHGLVLLKLKEAESS